MNPRPFAFTAGTLLVLIGAAGFAPPLVSLETDPLRQAAGVDHPQLFALFPVSEVLNGIHLALGAWGILSGRSLNASITYARQAAIVGFLLMLFGMIPGLDTLFGLAPLYGNNLLLHGALALLGFLFGWLYRRPRRLVDADADDDYDHDDEAYEG
jgi:hypothetical protein